MVVLHLAGEVAVVGPHIHKSVAGEVEEDGLGFAGFLAFQGLRDGGGNGVAAFRCGDDALRLGKQDAGLEGIKLLNVNGFHISVFH